jgi:GGDEF domain-containing protein
MDETTLFRLLDATGGGVCVLDEEGAIAYVSSGFGALTGAPAPIGRMPRDLLPELPALEEIAGRVDGDTAVFRQLGGDGVVRELSPALVRSGRDTWLVLVDRSGEARLRRGQARMGRELDDLRAELEALGRSPMGGRVRPRRELEARIDEALDRGRRYGHEVTILRIDAEEREGDDRGSVLLGCVRTVDDVGRMGAGAWAILLPHTDLMGGKIVGDRVRGRLGGGQVAVGVAQSSPGDAGAALVERAEKACRQAAEAGGGVLLAVDVL